MAKSISGASAIAIGALGVGAWALLRSGQAAQSDAAADGSSAAASGAGRGSGLPLSRSTAPASSASAATLPANWSVTGQGTNYSPRWGRIVLAEKWGGGANSTAVSSTSKGEQVQLSYVGRDATERSALWRSSAGIQRIPWDTVPADWFWDSGTPRGKDGGKTAQGSGEAVASALWSIGTRGVSDLVKAVSPEAHAYGFASMKTSPAYAIPKKALDTVLGWFS